MKQNFVCKDFKTSSFTVALNTTNYDVKTNSWLRTWVSNPVWFKLTTTQPINIKLNTTGWNNISITTTDNPFQIFMNDLSNVYITTTSAADIVFTLIWL